jgi:SAM-dependent methyltransferase
MSCTQCDGIEQLFDAKEARRRLRKLRRKGPDLTTRMLLEDVEAALRRSDGAMSESSLLLDIGAGVGAIHHELLNRGVARALHVDASTAYLSVAHEEVERRGHGERVEFVQGDFVSVAESIPAADIVTLDRVICCYHDMQQLVSRSAEKARAVYGAVYPREGWWTRLSIAATNLVFRIKGSSFRSYLHPPRDIDSALVARGLTRRSLRRTLAWEVVVYTRSGLT